MILDSSMITMSSLFCCKSSQELFALEGMPFLTFLKVGVKCVYEIQCQYSLCFQHEIGVLNHAHLGCLGPCFENCATVSEMGLYDELHTASGTKQVTT